MEQAVKHAWKMWMWVWMTFCLSLDIYLFI